MEDSRRSYQDVLDEIISLVDNFEGRHRCGGVNNASSRATLCHLCSQELTGKCLLQVCVLSSPVSGLKNTKKKDDETICKDCGKELSAKCILSICSGPNSSSLHSLACN